MLVYELKQFIIKSGTKLDFITLRNVGVETKFWSQNKLNLKVCKK